MTISIDITRATGNGGQEGVVFAIAASVNEAARIARGHSPMPINDHFARALRSAGEARLNTGQVQIRAWVEC